MTFDNFNRPVDNSKAGTYTMTIVGKDEHSTSTENTSVIVTIIVEANTGPQAGSIPDGIVSVISSAA